MSSLCACRWVLRCKPAQQRPLRRWAGQLRWQWNPAPAEQRSRHARGEKHASHADMHADMGKWLTGWRHCPVHPEQQVLRRRAHCS